MKSRLSKFCMMIFGICLFLSAMSITALAATSSITSIVVRVGTDTESGERLTSSIDLYTDSTSTHNGTYAGTNSTKYYLSDAEWVTSTSEYMSVGDEPKMRLYLTIADEDKYAFRGTYSSGNVTVRGGTFVSASRKSATSLEITVKLNGIKGQYPVPADASWSNTRLGRAIWNRTLDDDSYSSSLSSGYYDLVLYHGSSKIKEIENYNGTTIDFYPYMTKEGTYYYRVRTVPYTEEQLEYGKKSDWFESDQIYIGEEYVSDGSGQVDVNGISVDTQEVSWIYADGNWYYRYPDGSYQKDSWLLINGAWYLFDSNGRMLTGWQERNGRIYFLTDSGAMYSGWLKDTEGYWYYMNTINDGDIEGAMRKGWLTLNGRTYYFNNLGVMVEGWNEIDGEIYYFYPGTGFMATDTYIDSFYISPAGVWVR